MRICADVGNIGSQRKSEPILFHGDPPAIREGKAAPRFGSVPAAQAPQNILVVHSNNDLYGGDKLLLELLRSLDRTRYVPIVVLPTDTRHINRLSPQLEKFDIEYCFLPLGILRRRYYKIAKLPQFALEVAGSIRALGRLIRSRRVALVHTNTSVILTGALAARIARLPHIWSIHEVIVEPASIRRILHFLIPRLSTSVVAASRAVRDHMLRDSPRLADRFDLILGGIDVQPFLSADGRERVRKEWGIADDEVLIGMAGRVSRWKGQSVFAEAAELVSQKHANVKFAAVGGVFDTDTFYLDRFKEQVRKLGIDNKFIVSDYRADMADVFAAFDIFVLPSTSPEPLGLVVLEAMASGRAVVATAPGGPSEAVVDGETGYLVKPSDPHDIVAALENLLADPAQRRSMGEAGRKRACEVFNLPRYVRQFESLYDRILAARCQNALR